MLKINIYYWNNGVGIVNDAILLKSILKNFDVKLYDMSIINESRKSDLGIFIQNIFQEEIQNNKKNIYIINEEWINRELISCICRFDYIFVKSEHAKKLLEPFHKNIINTGFFSLDRYFFPKKTGNILHFKGKSIQKNTEILLEYKDIKILDSHINYLTENQVIKELNNHDIHICCSLYEGWGHYLWEAMSCGKLVICSEIPVFKEYLDANLVKFLSTEKNIKSSIYYEFADNSKYVLRESYFINEKQLKELLENKDELLEFQDENKDLIRDYFLYINNKNKQKFLQLIPSL